MSERREPILPTPPSPPVEITHEAVENQLDRLRNSTERLINLQKSSLDIRNKHDDNLVSYQERLMLLSLGIVGTSASAFIAFIGKYQLIGARKSAVMFLLISAWLMFLITAGIAR